MESKHFIELMEAFEKEYPLDKTFDRRKHLPALHLEIFKYEQLRRIADSLEKIADKKK